MLKMRNVNQINTSGDEEAGPDLNVPAAAPASPGRSPARRGWAVVAAVLAGLLLLGGSAGIGWEVVSGVMARSSVAAKSPIRAVPQVNLPVDRELDVQAVANKVAPAVVDINTVIQGSGGSGQGAGTGMLLTSSGQVLTNHHVVQGATSIKVSIEGRSGSYTAKVLGVDTSADVALVQIEGLSGLPTVTLADSSGLTTGQQVIALGNAFGRGGSPTVTSGTITGLNRSITASAGRGSSEELTGLIQSDAPISPGDSGGPLVNASGQVVGMITAGSAGRFMEATSRVGFAIPSNTAIDIVNQIRAGRASSTTIIGEAGYLGVGVDDLDVATATRLGLSVTSGALVKAVVAGSPAAQAGISQNAVITAIDGAAIASAKALGPAIQTHKPGQRISVTWVDQTGTHSATVSLMSGPAA